MTESVRGWPLPPDYWHDDQDNISTAPDLWDSVLPRVLGEAAGKRSNRVMEIRIHRVRERMLLPTSDIPHITQAELDKRKKQKEVRSRCFGGVLVDRVDEVTALAEAGHSIRETARTLGVGYTAVYKLSRARGIQFRRGWKKYEETAGKTDL